MTSWSHRMANWQVKLLFNSALLRKNVPTGVIFDHIFKFKTLWEASSFEGYFSFEYQIWNNGMTDVHRPPTLTLRSRTGAAKPTLWPTLNPCHFTIPCFIFKTNTFSFSSKQALSNNVFVVKIGRTTTLRRLFKVINFRGSKFVCTLWPWPVFGMCAAGLATHLTTPVCPVARTQTIILQVVYFAMQDCAPTLLWYLIDAILRFFTMWHVCSLIFCSWTWSKGTTHEVVKKLRKAVHEPSWPKPLTTNWSIDPME